MLNDDLFVIILNPNVFLFCNPHFLQLHPVAQATSSRIFLNSKIQSQKRKRAKTLVEYY